jgi:hypothetical protein
LALNVDLRRAGSTNRINSVKMETMMRYLCLVYVDPSLTEQLSESEGRKITKDSLAYDDELRAGGHFVHSNALQDPPTAVSIRVRGGQVSTTDGPFAETKEHLGGFILIEARDLNEAIGLGAKIPMARMGTIEVRPLLDLV